MAINDALITPAYRAQNRALLRAGMGGGGARHGATVVEFVRVIGARSVLDYGCGSGQLAKWLGKHHAWLLVREFDPAIPKKAATPKPADLVVCTDVLEHVEPDAIDNVLGELRRLAKRGAFLSIATRPSNKTLPDGRNAHLIVKPAAWWLWKFRAMGWAVRDRRVVGTRALQLWLTGR